MPSKPDFNAINPHIIHCLHTNRYNSLPPGKDYGLRYTKWFELELFNWSEGYCITERKKIETRKGDLHFRQPGMETRGFAPYDCYLIIFDMMYSPSREKLYDPTLEPYGHEPLGKKRTVNEIRSEWLHLPYTMTVSDYDVFHGLFVSIYREYINRQPNAQFLMKAQLMEILRLLYLKSISFARIQSSRSLNAHHARIMEVKNHIDKNIRGRFRLEKLAEMAGLSPNFFCKIFKSIIGESPLAYVNRNKIKFAKQLLLETKMPIKEIVAECGFESVIYFYAVFKKREMLTPVEFRNRHQIFLGD